MNNSSLVQTWINMSDNLFSQIYFFSYCSLHAGVYIYAPIL